MFKRLIYKSIHLNCGSGARGAEHSANRPNRASDLAIPEKQKWTPCVLGLSYITKCMKLASPNKNDMNT